MIYENIIQGIFISRPNRFIAHIMVDGKDELCHVKNTGRCAELLIPGAVVYVQAFLDHPHRKTKYDLICVYKGNRLINMDSQVPNTIFREYVEKGLFIDEPYLLKSEVTYKNSRFDFFLETPKRKIFIEIKGVTLEENGVVQFPDAPTKRGLKHVQELIHATEDGFEAYIIFVIQMEGVEYFTPNDMTQSEFGDALFEAIQNGVQVLAFDTSVTPHSIEINQPVQIKRRST